MTWPNFPWLNFIPFFPEKLFEQVQRSHTSEEAVLPAVANA